MLGDVNEDGMVDAKDSSEVLVYYSRMSTDMEYELSSAQYTAADVNTDKMVDAKDALLILDYYSFTATGGTSAGISEYLDMINYLY